MVAFPPFVQSRLASSKIIIYGFSVNVEIVKTVRIEVFCEKCFSGNMNSGINSPGAAAASCNMKDSGGMKS